MIPTHQESLPQVYDFSRKSCDMDSPQAHSLSFRHPTCEPAENSTGASHSVGGEGPVLFISSVSWISAFIKYKTRHLDTVGMSNCT